MPRIFSSTWIRTGSLRFTGESKLVRTWSSRGLIEMVNSIANATIISKRDIDTEENNEKLPQLMRIFRF